MTRMIDKLKGEVSNSVTTHNSSSTAHADIRELISNVSISSNDLETLLEGIMDNAILEINAPQNISFHVVDNNIELKNVKVTLYADNTQAYESELTNNNGECTISNVAKGIYEVNVTTYSGSNGGFDGAYGRTISVDSENTSFELDVTHWSKSY